MLLSQPGQESIVTHVTSDTSGLRCQGRLYTVLLFYKIWAKKASTLDRLKLRILVCSEALGRPIAMQANYIYII